MTITLVVACLAYVGEVYGATKAVTNSLNKPQQNSLQDEGFNLRRLASRTKEGFSELLENNKKAKILRSRIEKHPGSTRVGKVLSYPELSLLRKSGEDRNKVLFPMVFAALSKEPILNAAYFSYFFGLPSTFTNEKGQMQKLRTLAQKRGPAAYQLLNTIEAQTVPNWFNKGQARIAASQMNLAGSALRSRSTKRAMQELESLTLPPAQKDKAYNGLKAIHQRQERRMNKRNAKLAVARGSGAGAASLLGTSQPVLKAGCKYIGSLAWVPGPFRRNALGKHLERLVEEDDTLMRRGGVRSLSHAQLVEACCDRGFVSLDHSDRKLRSCLRGWLHTVRNHRYEPHRARLAAMAMCSVASMRKEKDSTLRMLSPR